MAKLILESIDNIDNAKQLLNNNLQKIEEEFQKVLYRTGEEPNQIEDDVDFNGKGIYNLEFLNIDGVNINLPELIDIARRIPEILAAAEEAELIIQGFLDNLSDNLDGYIENLLRQGFTELGIAVLDSPNFTGNPRVPNQPLGDNSTKIANTAFVQQELTNLISSSPEALNTLNELAAALGNDPNFATTILNALSTKVGKFDYATPSAGGLLKVRQSGNYLYLSTDGSNP